MRRYQKFLSSGPSFIGFGLSDLIVLCVGLNLSLVFRLESNSTLVLAGGSVLVYKLVKKYVDVTGFILGLRRTENISWKNLKEKHDESI